MNYLTYLLRRSVLNWQLLLTLTLGVVLAVALMASGPVIVDTVLDFSLRRSLITTDPQEAHLRLTTQDNLDLSRYAGLNDEIRNLFQSQLGDQLERTISSGETSWAYPWVGGEVQSRQRINFRFYGLGWGLLTQNASFISGGLPEDSRIENGVIEAVVTESLATQYALNTGDELPFSVQTSADGPNYTIQVAGIIKPVDSQDPIWFGAASPLRSHADARYVSQHNVLVGSNEFFEIASLVFPSSRQAYSWISLLDTGKITLRDLPEIEGQINELSFEAQAIGEGLDVDTGLPQLISRIVPESEGVRAPLYFLIAAVVLLALYYVMMVATLSTRQSRREFAVLRSRGASRNQILGLQLIEASVISTIGLISGPGLAVLLMRWLVQSGPLADVAQADWLLTVPQGAWLAAIVATTACLMSLFGPSTSAVQRSIVTHAATLSRSGKKPRWQRYYLDVILLIVGLILLWRLNLYGGIIEGSGASARVDWLLLLSPLALLLGAATITLRVFPLLLDLGSKIVSRGRGLSGALALWQAARDPVHVARLVLLLTLAMALGMLSTGLNSALDRNEQDRSNYAIGSDVRVVLPEDLHRAVGEGKVSSIGEVTATVPDVVSIVSALRTTGSLQMTVANAHPQFDLLAVPPEEFSQVTFLREDFASLPVEEMLTTLSPASETGSYGYKLPGQPSRIGAWLLLPFQGEAALSFSTQSASAEYLDISLLTKLRTSNGEAFSLYLRDISSGADQGGGWRYFEAELPALSPPNYPVELDSIWIKTRLSTYYESSILTQVGIDALSIYDTTTKQDVIFEDFETDSSEWGVGHPGSWISIEQGYSYSGESHLMLDYWASGVDSTEWVKLTVKEEDEPFPTEVRETDEQSPPADDFQVGLPPQAHRIGLWVSFPVIGRYQTGTESWRRVGHVEDLGIELVLQNSRGEELILPLEVAQTELPPVGSYSVTVWHRLEAEVPESSHQEALALSAIRVQVAQGAMIPKVLIDDLSAETDLGMVEVDSFTEDALPNWVLEQEGVVGHATSELYGHAGSTLAITFASMGKIGGLGWVVVKPQDFLPPVDEEELDTPPIADQGESPNLAVLPVLVSEAFLETTQTEIGDHVGAWIDSRPFQLEVVGLLEYFPTMIEAHDAGFVITNRNVLMQAVNQVEQESINANEYFISVQPGTATQVRSEIQDLFAYDVEILDAESLRKTIKSDPLALGLRSVTTLGYVLTSVLSLVGFGTYFYVSVRQRRKMYAVLRAFGMSSAQLYGTLLLEQLILVFSGLGLGTGLGLLLNALTLPGLPLSLGGQPPIPPFLAEIEWVEVGRIYLTLAVAFLVSLVLATISLSRARLHRIMRVDEE
jgi:ABC-type antimicrobial peptide transport system permease subunit